MSDDIKKYDIRPIVDDNEEAFKAMADQIEYAISTEGKATLFEEHGRAAVSALRAAAPSPHPIGRVDREGGFNAARMYAPEEFAQQAQPAPSPHPRGEPVGYGYSAEIQSAPGNLLHMSRVREGLYDTPLYAAPPPAGADAVRVGQAGVHTIPLPMWAAEDLLKWMRKANDRKPVLYPIGLENLLQALVSALSPAPQPQEKPTGDQT